MALVLDGYPLVLEDEDGSISSLITKYLPLDSYYPWYSQTWPGFGLSGLSFPNRQRTDPPLQIGKFYWPASCASRWAYGNFLCDSDTVGLIGADVYGSGGAYNTVSLSIGNPESNNGGTIVPGEMMTTEVYLLPPTPLSGIRGLTGMVRSLYLLTVVDVRYFWWWMNMGDITIDNSTTWESLIDGIAAILDVTITPDEINSAYLQPSIQMFSLPYEPIPLILDAICFNIGHRFISYYDGTYSTQLYNTALDAFNTDMNDNASTRKIMAGGQRFDTPL